MKRSSSSIGIRAAVALGSLLWVATAASAARAIAEAEPAEDVQAEVAQAEVAQPESAAAEAAGSVARGVFTSGIVDREPIDEVRVLENDATQIYYFSELRDLAGQSVVHRWEFNGSVMAEVPFDVGGSRWRVSSSKTLDPSWLGDWTVSVVDGAGRVLQQDTFTYIRAVADAAPAPPVLSVEP
ncbi:MAG: DUF2914 domain-containing protein [Myxococcales bacterium]|nr:DUF2914 domain-containing protein [Myxococcales bacterium]MDH5567135.1 DUF2914 domain-containing protein [Myxococcales bacterium]